MIGNKSTRILNNPYYCLNPRIIIIYRIDNLANKIKCCNTSANVRNFTVIRYSDVIYSSVLFSLSRDFFLESSASARLATHFAS